ncbi:hypothetical protein LMH87_004137 [Akanthomyces muscarius]|uniref:Cytochrome P450 oxidoreductase OrdA-like protein n=1 Tax=Akanthomyces muscarius TaxID=2231603 RepID=A0A9W8Q5W6_AKAMU|nr:hypothetical protein LMH87_004137 [Akanthomyces muscarius]KAJ4145282.1 hypothetical protein LMH87_004137 [Akanthomyces muscarius]
MATLPSLGVLWASPTILIPTVFIALFLASRLFFPGKSGGRHVLPPGPARLPFIGNLLDMPPPGVPEFQHWLKHKERYGSVSSVTVMGQTIVILHSKEAARFILDKYSKSTASRPHMEFGHNMCGYDNLLPVQKSEDGSYRRRRQLVHQQLGTPAASERYKDVHEQHAGELLQQVLDSPERLMDHLKCCTAASVLDATYGYTLESSTEVDPLVTLIQRLIDNATEAFVPMAWLVDAVPALKYLPSWLPGTGFIKTAKAWKQTGEEVANKPYALVQEQMRNGTHRPSYVSGILDMLARGDNANDDGGDNGGSGSIAEEPSRDRIDEEDIKWTAASMYGAGVETSTSTLEGFILAMVMFPEVQLKAQREIDSVVGPDRLPTFQDQLNLPYTAHVVMEALRWFPVVPMGIVHTSQKDIIYDKYLIPKGSYLLPAVWWFCHDPEVYADPEAFDPDRYREPRNEPDPRTIVFGFGRRVCPGRYFADSSLFIAVARLLAAFTITDDVDEQGRATTAELKHRPSMTSRPVNFPFKIVPRSARHATLVRNSQATG